MILSMCYSLTFVFITTIYFKEMEFYEFKISFFVNNFRDLFFPTLLGSLPIALIMWFITFNLCKNFLIKKINEKKNKTRH